MPGCEGRKDFLRHIVNPRISEALLSVDEGRAVDTANRKPDDIKQIASKLSSVLGDIRKRIVNAENSYNFSIYGGSLEGLARYLSSSAWDDLVQATIAGLREYPDALNYAVNVVAGILAEASEAYRDSCPQVSEAAQRALARLNDLVKSASKSSPRANELTKSQQEPIKVVTEGKGQSGEGWSRQAS